MGPIKNNGIFGGGFGLFGSPNMSILPNIFASPAVAQPLPYDPKTYETKLSPSEEKAFAVWKRRYAPKDSGRDYDLRGAFKMGFTPDPTTGHWPDTFKKPSHPTFSNESIYAKDRPDLAGRWDGETYIPPPTKK